MADKSNIILGGSLNRAQRRLVRDYFERDKDALYDVGMDDVEIFAFLNSAAVQDELHRLTGEFDDRKQQMERIRHRVRLDLAKLAPLAVGVIQQALLGRLVNKEDGSVSEPPDRAQVDAAREVMHNLGIAEKIQDVGDADIFIDNRQINFPGSLSAGSSSAASKREHIRSFVESVLADAENAHAEKHGARGRLIDVEATVKEKRKKKRKKKKSKK